MDKDTIAAIATPIGCSGIGIVRISGNRALSIAQKLFLPHRSCGIYPLTETFDGLKSHYLHYGYIHEQGKDGILDEVLLAVMKAPKSYTREDVVEIQSHSGSVILSKILKLVIDCGARLSEPGEFTKRAFLNGRIDLSQAEAIAEMINAKTEVGLKLAGTHLYGGLKNAISEFIDLISDIQVEIEAAIEFPDDVESFDNYEEIAAKIQNKVVKPIEELLRHYEDGHVLRDGIRLDIVGRPNVGKSSLLNRLIQKDKAIVTHIPGTTRDLIEDHINIEGIPILVTDTAGLHITDDPVEIIGIQKTKANISMSDLVLWVIDAESGFTEEDRQVFEQIGHQNILLVINKKDLLKAGLKVDLPDEFMTVPKVMISAKFGSGIARLKDEIKGLCLREVNIEPGRTLIP
ncbi:MAG: tRNA uridine-5-carboxymethylaminomethyl(34) synthesis GTPase MnmE, partial [Desulfobacteraceae bacterium]